MIWLGSLIAKTHAHPNASAPELRAHAAAPSQCQDRAFAAIVSASGSSSPSAAYGAGWTLGRAMASNSNKKNLIQLAADRLSTPDGSRAASKYDFVKVGR